MEKINNEDEDSLNRKIEHHRECCLRFSLWIVCPVFPGEPTERKEKYRRSAIGHFEQWQRYLKKKERLKKYTLKNTIQR